MRKKFLGAFMLGLLALGTTSTVTSCKDYDGDISSLKSDQAALQKTIANLQTALDQAKADANTAHATFALKTDLEALKTEVAKLVTAADLQKAIDNCKAALQGGYDGTMNDLALEIDGIDSRLNALESTLSDPETGLAAAHANIAAQKKALEDYKEEVTALLGTKVDQATYDKEVASIEKTLKELSDKDAALQADIDQLKKDMKDVQNTVDSYSANIDILTVFVNSRLTSLVLRPDMYYGGIEGVRIFSVTTPVDKANDAYHYYLADGTVSIPSMGIANYHYNPTTADLSNANINFYSWQSEINSPACYEESSRAADGNKNLVWPVYKTYAELVKNQKQENDGIITVPFKADIASIDAALDKSIGTIMALQLTQKVTESKDTTITSDYALVIAKHGYQLLVGDNSFVDANGAQTHKDQITQYTAKVENGTERVDSDYCDNNHLHRSFDYLAKSNVPATHEVYYQDKINISALLTTHYINTIDPQEAVQDTAVIDPHKGSWTAGKADGNATVMPKDCDELSADDLAALGLHYEIHTVSYTLGTNGTDETAHIELVTDENGTVWAYPRSVEKSTGATITGKTADVGAIGRMPILCIEVKNEAGQTVAFGYMKLLITDKAKSTEFKTSDIYADCSEAMGAITWHEFEVQMLEEVTSSSKDVFDATYEAYKSGQGTQEIIVNDATQNITYKTFYQFDANGNQLATAKTYGEVRERHDFTEGGKEDPTTHIIYWYFSKDQYFQLFNELYAAGKLKDNGDGSYVNTEDIVTYVYYVVKNTTDTRNGIQVKLTIPAGKYHFAKGTLGGAKVLSYWYELNSKTNAVSSDDAKEVRVNVPVPTPGTPGVRGGNTHELGVNCIDDVAAEGSTAIPSTGMTDLTWYNDDVLEDFEFTKDLHDYFLDGKLSGAITDKKNFDDLAKSDIVPEFQFTLPSKSLGNATFDAKDGMWEVTGYTGAKYTLKLASSDADHSNNEIQIVKVNGKAITPVMLACLSEDAEGIQSVIKYHQNSYADDILNYKGHDELAELETFTAYIQIVSKDACAPVIYDQPWFNVRFIRPLDFLDPSDGVVPDAPNDWQYVELTKALTVKDWRNYTGDPTNSTKGTEVAKKLFDFAYYQVVFEVVDGEFLTDAQLGTGERDQEVTLGKQIDLNNSANAAYAAKCIKTGRVQNLDFNAVSVGQTVKKDNKDYTVQKGEVWIKYKNNSGVVGNFHVFVPVQMEYVFGQKIKQFKYVTVGVSSSVDQPMIAE